MQITNFRHQNRQRGAATVLASFSVDFGPYDVNGFELIEAGGKTFVGVPNRWNPDTKKEFKFIFFKDGEGMRMLNELAELAQEELERRDAPQQRPSSGYGKQGSNRGRNNGYSRGGSNDRRDNRSDNRNSGRAPARSGGGRYTENVDDEDTY